MDQLLLRKVLKVLPLVTLLYSFWLLYVALGILQRSEQNYAYFLFLTFQVYTNWAAIVSVPSNCTSARRIMKPREQKEKHDIVKVDLLGYEDKMYAYSNPNYYDDDQHSIKKNISNSVNDDFVSYSNYIADADLQRIWYCPKCCLNCLPNCRHCPLCSKCIFERDHHCFFLGACIGRQNMKHFIVILLYTGLVCMYVFNLVCAEMNLYEGVSKDSTLILRHFFPISFVKWISGQEGLYNLMRILILNTTGSITLFCVIFELYHLYLVLSGKLLNKLQKNRKSLPGFKNVPKNFNAIFGDFGIVNFIVPIGFAETVMKKYL